MAYSNMREANVERGIEWSNGAKDGPLFYAIELFGEAGELLNVVKKLERERLGMVGSRATMQDLTEELADAVICLDLLAIAYDLPIISRYDAADDWTSYEADALAVSFGRAIGQVLLRVEYVEKEKAYWGEHLPETFDNHLTMKHLAQSLTTALMYAEAISVKFNIDLRSAVVAKFNKTSEKYGLAARMASDAEII